MASAPVRDQLGDHLITPQNAALVLIDYQPSHTGGSAARRFDSAGAPPPTRTKRPASRQEISAVD
jgi:hypothetical protein